VGLKDLFSSAGRSKNRLDKSMRGAINPYGQSADRYYAMQTLLDIGTLPALIGLMRRFTINASKSIEDEEEKSWVYNRLIGLDKALVLAAAKEFCINAENIAWVLRIVEELADKAQEWDILDALIAKHPPAYERDPSKKMQLLGHLADIDDPRVEEILARYLDDPDESVRFHVVEALLNNAEGEAQPDPRVLEPLVARLGHKDEDSLRLRSRILTGLGRLKWDLSAHKDRILPYLGSEHTFEGGRIKDR
jgi:HEAT repeat protein